MGAAAPDTDRGVVPRPAFGISVAPFAAAHAEIVEQVLAADRGGLDLVGIQSGVITDGASERFAAEVAPAVRERVG